MSRKITTLAAMACILVLLLLAASLAWAQGPRRETLASTRGMLVLPAQQPVREPVGAQETTSPRGPGEIAVTEVVTHDFDVLLWGDDFESGTGAWAEDGLWHAVTDTHPSGYGNSHSAVTSYWYGQNATGDYDTGETNVGVLKLTTPISLPSSLPSARLSFWSWEETECEGGSCGADIRRLQLSTDPVNPVWTTIWTTEISETIEGSWHLVRADLTPYIGNDILLRFEFDSVEEMNNDYRGWYLDDVAVGYDWVGLAPLYQEGYTWRGQKLAYTVTLTNNTGLSDTFDLGVSGDDWLTSLLPDTLGPIQDGDSAEFKVYVWVPSGACYLCSDWIEVTATNQAETVSGSAVVRTYHPYEMRLWRAWASPETGGAPPGDTFTYSLRLGNDVGFDDSFTLALGGETWPTALSISNTGVIENWGLSGPFEAYVTVPVDAPPEASDSVTVTASSDTNPLYSESLVLTTFATAQGGYRYVDDGAACPYHWIDTTSSPISFTLSSEKDYGELDLGFDFPFYGNSYSQVRVSPFGFLTFGDYFGTRINAEVPQPSYPNALIAAFWDDLDPRANTTPDESLVFAQTFGTAPNRYAVVEWYRIPHSDEPSPTTQTLTFEAILYENGEMNFQYYEMEGQYGDGESASVGVENGAGTIGVEYLCNGSPSAHLIQHKQAICWGPWRIYLPLVLKHY